VATDLVGSSCVLTKTNDEALQITGFLLRKGMQARLIQTNEGFSLNKLCEVRFFLDRINLSDDVFIISDDIWENAKRELFSKFQRSTRLELCRNIISDFEATNPYNKYKSDLEVFIRESDLEDFYSENGETIFVSTMHKAKGKEFDNVFLMLDDFYPVSDEDKRLLYVAMTRAKHNLCIHLNRSYLDGITAQNTVLVADTEIYHPPRELAMHLTHKDVWLDYFINKQGLISKLQSGDVLIPNGNECLNARRQSVLKFSSQFMVQIGLMKENNYELKSAGVNFILYWQKEGTDKELKIILPELIFERAQGCQP
jgi:ATP-dependent DNA helicase RecQ